jgi:bacillolysin
MKTFLPFLVLLIFLGFWAPSMAQQSDPFAPKTKTRTAPVQQPVEQLIDGRRQAPGPRAAQFFSPLASPAPVPAAPGHRVEVLSRDAQGLPTAWLSEGSPAATRDRQRPEAAQAAAVAYLAEVKSMLQLDDPQSEMVPGPVTTDALGHTHVRLTQTFAGYPVYGAEMAVHFRPGGQIFCQGHLQPTPLLAEPVPTFDEAQAVAAALADLQTRTTVRPWTAAERQYYDYQAPEATLVVYRTPGYLRQTRLAWLLEVRPNFVEHWHYFVDATDGRILHSFDHTCSFGPRATVANDLDGQSRPLQVFDGPNNRSYLIDASKPMYTGPTNQLPALDDGIILTMDMGNNSTQNGQYSEITSANNSWPATAVSAHYHAGLVYDYFSQTFNYNSFNGQGADLISFINVADENGSGLDNAFWNGQFMFYGNGNVAFTRSLAAALDVSAHEMSHGVIQETANLIYENQSGALNESFADVFAVLVDRDDWQLAETVANPQVFSTGAMRDMANPNNGGTSLNQNGYQPQHMSELYTGTEDNGGVHINSGIPNRAFYLFATATSRSIAEQVYFRALSQYLTRSSEFADCRIAVLQAAADLHGAGSSVVNAAANAFDQVGILGTGGNPNPGTGNQQDLPINPGQDFIVSQDINPADPTQLYISSTTGTNYQPLSNTEPQTRVSLTDNGSWGYFVGTDKHIYELAMNPNNSQETGLSNNPEWDNVAISKDGRRMAAVSTSIDTSIFVFDFSGPTVRAVKYRLYNPTTANGGINGGGVLYADAISWDFSGEFVMYDAFNRVNGTFGNNIEYWDIGFLRAWDNGTNDFGDGQIFKLFSNLDQGVSAGNAEFSKNSPYIIAFDYINSLTGTIEIVGANLETGETGSIFTQAELGYPSFSKLDDQLLFNASTTAGDQIVASIPLANNKIQAGGQAAGLIPDARLGVWYATGNRNLSVSNALPLTVETLRVAPNPFSGRLTWEMELNQPQQVSVALYDLRGQRIHDLLAAQELPSGPQALSWELVELPAGMYLLRTQVAGQVTTAKVVKQ